MMKIPCVRMPSLDICYGAKSPDQQPLPNAQWNLTSLKSFIHSPGATDRINYLLLVDSIMQDKANTTSIYETAFNNLLKEYGICTGAVRLAVHEISGIGGASYDSLKTSMKRPLENMKKARPTANFAILLLKSRSIPAYAAFKEVVDRHLGLQSLCMTQTPNIEKGRRECKKDILQYMANIMMKANLKWGGGNHTVQLAKEPKSKIQVILKDTLVLGADLTHPGPGSLVGCPSIAAVVGSVDSAATTFRGSMRLQDTCKKDVGQRIRLKGLHS
jgi:eukaryotic translation initiation factor 2C